jgi:GNAT superfamily N-acetyltransferase
MTLDIVPLDAADPAAMAAWHTAYHAADVHRREYSSPWMLEEVRADLLGARTGDGFLAFSGLAGGAVVGTGLLRLPLKDNLHLATAQVHTHPEHRRRGHGTAMLEHLAGVARAHGRRTLLAEAATPYAGQADGSGHPNADFLLHRGFTTALGEVMRVLDLPADTRVLERLAGEAAPYHRAYTLRRFRGPVPEDILEPFGHLVGSLGTEAPSGELELEAEAFDAERVRADEAVFEASGRTKYTTVAVAADGAVVAYSELVVPRFDPGRLYQWGTLVLREHRGRRLGQATKAHNLLWVQRELSGLKLLVTYNAEVNRHMIAVNEAMGFRPVERLTQYQRPL